MIRRAVFLSLALLLAIALAPTTVRADSRETFRITVIGIPVGVLHIAREERAGKSYVYASQFATNGLLSMVRDVKFALKSSGHLTGPAPRPAWYAESMNTGRRASSSKVEFGPRDDRWDPNTMMAVVMNDRPVSQGCAMKRKVFDGKRTNVLTLRPARQQGDRLTCTGRFQRRAGYRPEDLEKRTGYDVQVTYRRAGDMLLFEAAQADTDYGRVRVEPQ